MTTNKKDYYDVLGLSRNATSEDVKKAFRRLAFEHHPDRNKTSGSEGRFKEVNEAYEVLRDESKRAAYDRFGHAGVGSDGFGTRGAEGFSGFGGFGDIFDAFFGGARGAQGARSSAQRGPDLAIEVRLSFDDAVRGTKQEVRFARMETCTACRGSGAEPGTQPEACPSCRGSGEVRRSQQSLFGQYVNISACNRCRGEGKIVSHPCKACRGARRVTRDHTIQVIVPSGVDSGNRIRMSGEGEAGVNGGPPGDLYVEIDVESSGVFEREGVTLFHRLPVNIAQAALGADVTIPTLEGDETFHVPSGVQSGQSFKLRGRGVADVQDARRRGDLVIVASVHVPGSLTDQQRGLLEELSATLPGTAEMEADGDRKGFFEWIKRAFDG